MSEHPTAHLQKQIKVYTGIFAIIIVLTLATVFISRQGLSTGMRVTVALLIATVQGVLSASYFMHLNTEKKSIHWFLILAGFFLILVISLPLLTSLDPVK